MENITFLSTEDVIALQQNTLEHEGGLAGVKDYNLLDSAVHMPRQQFGGRYLHDDLAAMAAAYLYHLTANHAFNDGNKRIGLLAALTFLYENGIDFQPPADELERVVLGVANSLVSKDELIAWFRAQMTA